METIKKTEIKKQLKKDALFRAAFDLFTNSDTRQASISDIAKRAGVAKGTFYLYFKDKYDIKKRLIRKKASAVFAEAGRAADGRSFESFEEEIIFLIDHIINQLTEDKRLLTFISKNLSWGLLKNALRDSDEELDEEDNQLYNRLILTASKTYFDSEILLYMIVELVSSSIYTSILFGEPVPIEKLKPHLYQTIRMMIRSKQRSTA